MDLLPNDDHNRRLVGLVHPPDWKNPEPKPLYDMVIIGAGTAGLVCAAGAAGLGAKVALIERGLMGGDCLNYGCVPSKALLHAAREKMPFEAAMERLRRLRADIARHDSAERFTSLGVDVFLGEGRFADARTITVGGARLRFKRAVIATGARAAAPAIPGLSEAGYLTNETLFSLTELPPRLAIIGSGPIGVEMAQAFRRLGSQVTLIEQSGEILPREDADAAAIVRAALDRDGVRVVLNSGVARIEVRGEDKIVVLNTNEQVACDAILVAVGRAPNVEGLGLESAGVRFDARHGVSVNDNLRTANARVFACGDVCMEKKFTHAADFAARTVIQNALFFGRKKLSALNIPWCTYTTPELAHVGLNAGDAEKRDIAIDTFTVPFSGVDRATLEDDTEGFFRVHVRKGTDTIVGATMVSPHAGESILSVVLAMNNGIGLGKIASAICPYPTQADAIRKAGDLYSRTRLTPRAARLLRALIALNR